MADMTDISDTLLAKSDFLSSDELIGGPITIEVTSVDRTSEEMRIKVGISGGHKPWMPCKSCRRVMVAGWGKDATKWIGKKIKLYRDPKVKWQGEVVGGIRIAAMSDIPSKLEIALAETRGKKKLVVVEKLGDAKPATSKTASPPAANPLLESFTAMKARWKSRRENVGAAFEPDDFRAWIVQTTEGAIASVDALSLSKYTAEVIEHCESVIRETMPEQL